MSGVSKEVKEMQDELKWIQIRNDLDYSEKKKNKFLENPFVPIGLLVTTGVLINGLRHFVRQDSRKQQIMMRCRVLAQGFTLAALSFGVYGAEMYKKENHTDSSDLPESK